MAIKDILKTHQTWEDGVALLLGLTVGLAPWLCWETSNGAAIVNSAISGLAVLMLAQLELVHFRRWEEKALLICGIWIAASPHVFGYAQTGQLRIWHWSLGALIALLAMLEIWQDWHKSRS